MSEEKKKNIKKIILGCIIAMGLVVVGYVVISLINKQVNMPVYAALLVAFVLAYLILADFVEPKLTGLFMEMDSYRKNAYWKYVILDVVCMAALLVFALGFMFTSESMFEMIAVAVYVICVRKKRPYKSIYCGELTKDEIEQAKTGEESEE